MKKILACLLMLAVYTGTQAQNETPYLTKPLTGAAIQKVVARTSGGSLTVIGQTAGENRVEVYITSSNGNNKDLSKEEIQKKLEADYTLDVTVDGGQLTLTAKQKDGPV